MRIEIWSDVVCPWCYIGKRRFEAALDLFEKRDEVEIAWRSYELNPNAPRRTTGTLNEYLAEKYGVSLQEAAAMNTNVTKLAAQEGLTYKLEQAKHGNTFDAHRLTHFAASKGLREKLTERLFQAYFTEGADLNDADTLIRLSAEVGLDETETRAVLQSQDYGPAVREDENLARRLGIQGVPFFVIDSKYGISGAQPVETFLEVLRKAVGLS